MPNNCKSPEMCMLSETCVPCEICPNAKEKADDRLALTACSRSSIREMRMECGKCGGFWVSPENAQKLMNERDKAMERISYAEILLSDLATGYWRAILNDQDPTGEGIMGERVMAYWAQYSENETSPSVDETEMKL